MAIGQTVSASASYIVNPTGVSPTLASTSFTPAQVEGTVVNDIVRVDRHARMPGVFTIGTPREGGGHQANI